jgi:phosphate transport system substrate-binding protein
MHRRRWASAWLVALCALFVSGVAGAQSPRERVRYVDTALTHRYALAVAQHIAANGHAPRAIGEATDSSGALRLFCAGAGTLHPDVLIATRPLSQRERDTCTATGVTDVTVVPLGFDVIALARRRTAPGMALTRAHVWKALAAEVPIDGVLQPNPYRRWHEIDPVLPDEAIRVYGPPEDTGLYSTLVDLAMTPACMADDTIAAVPGFERAALCGTVRADGVYVSAEREAVLQALEAQQEPAIGVVPYALLVTRVSAFAPLTIDGQRVTSDTLADGSYALGRPLYLLYKPQHLSLVPGILTFAAGFLTDDASGPRGYLLDDGFMPAPEVERKAALDRLLRKGQ